MTSVKEQEKKKRIVRKTGNKRELKKSIKKRNEKEKKNGKGKKYG